MKIVLSVIIALFMVACSDTEEKKSKSKTTQETTAATTVEKNLPDSNATAPSQKVEEIVVEESDKVIEVASEPANEVSTSVEVVKESVPQELVAVKAADGAKLFRACSGCHGVNGEKKALGKSQVIQGWSEDKTLAALKGYKDGSYGGAMKGVMKGQASKLSDAEIEALAEYIASLHE